MAEDKKEEPSAGDRLADGFFFAAGAGLFGGIVWGVKKLVERARERRKDRESS